MLGVVRVYNLFIDHEMVVVGVVELPTTTET